MKIFYVFDDSATEEKSARFPDTCKNKDISIPINRVIDLIFIIYI